VRRRFRVIRGAAPLKPVIPEGFVAQPYFVSASFVARPH